MVRVFTQSSILSLDFSHSPYRVYNIILCYFLFSLLRIIIMQKKWLYLHAIVCLLLLQAATLYAEESLTINYLSTDPARCQSLHWYCPQGSAAIIDTKGCGCYQTKQTCDIDDKKPMPYYDKQAGIVLHPEKNLITLAPAQWQVNENSKIKFDSFALPTTWEIQDYLPESLANATQQPFQHDWAQGLSYTHHDETQHHQLVIIPRIDAQRLYQFSLLSPNLESYNTAYPDFLALIKHAKLAQVALYQQEACTDTPPTCSQDHIAFHTEQGCGCYVFPSHP